MLAALGYQLDASARRHALGGEGNGTDFAKRSARQAHCHDIRVFPMPDCSGSAAGWRSHWPRAVSTPLTGSGHPRVGHVRMW